MWDIKMRRHGFYIACIAITFALPAGADEAADCNSVASCLALAPVTAASVSGIGEAERRIATAIARLGPTVLPELVIAIDTDNSYAREIIDYAVSRMEDLVPEDFALVRQIMLKDPEYSPGRGGWSYRAMATIGTDEAIKFLAADLLAANSASNQIGFAFKKLGDKGLPYLAEALKCRQNCDPDQLQGIFEVFRDMREEARGAAGPLLEIAQNKNLGKQIRRTAIRSLGFIAASVKDIDRSMDVLAREDASLVPEVREALIGVKSPLAVDYIMNDLREYTRHQYPDPVRQLAALGRAGVAAGPDLLGLLKHEDWNARVDVAYALGSIEYRNAVPELIKTLADESDWKLAYVAIYGLSRMRDPSALPALREAAAAYWYPPVRALAACAVRYIESGKNQCEKRNGILDLDMLGLEYTGEESAECKTMAYSPIDEPSATKQYAEENGGLKRFKYRISRVTLYPGVAAKVRDGWLTGRDYGEFGGELMFLSRKGKSYRVLEENIEDIYVLNEGAIAITGLAHLVFNRGMVYDLRQDAAGKWRAQPLVRLPGAPHASYKISNDEIFVQTYNGAIVLNAFGDIKMAACSD